MTHFYQILKKDYLWILLPALLWVGTLQSRDLIIDKTCLKPGQCRVEDIPQLDRLGMVGEDEAAHHLSFKTQNASAWVAASVPLGLRLASIAVRGVAWPVALVGYASDFFFLLKIVVWNGLATEAVKVTTQRVRPHVYKHPSFAGGNAAHYTSFYSGHTSFTAACGFGLFFLLVLRGAGRSWRALALIFALGMTFWTGALRVVSARHFISDVMVGGLAGALVAGIFFFLARQTQERPFQESRFEE